MFPFRPPNAITSTTRPHTRTTYTDAELKKLHPCERLEVLRARSQNGPRRKRNKKQNKKG